MLQCYCDKRDNVTSLGKTSARIVEISTVMCVCIMCASSTLLCEVHREAHCSTATCPLTYPVLLDPLAHRAAHLNWPLDCETNCILTITHEIAI